LALGTAAAKAVVMSDTKFYGILTHQRRLMLSSILASVALVGYFVATIGGLV
jgi:hypothetical protein